MIAVANPVLVDGMQKLTTEEQNDSQPPPPPNEEDNRPVVGIIYPPPDIRNIVDKTAVFVARNGIQFEERIRENEKHNAKFSFLNPNDPYHAYYQYKITETKEGKTPKKAEPKEAPTQKKDEGLPPKAPPKEPPQFEFMCDMPAISAQDLDILKLTAQFVARNGRQFMTALSQREQRNYQFDFLRPNHSLFNYFTKLVEQYTKVLIPQKNLNERLNINTQNKYQILDRVMQRVEYAAFQEEERKKAEEKEDQERIAYASIDWHDFVIVETVEFTEADETLDLPPPMSIMELENMTLAQKKMASVMMEAPNEDRNAEEDMEMDDDVDMEEDDNEDEHPTLSPQQHLREPSPEPEPAVVQIKPPDATMPIKIRKDYVPKVNAPKQASQRPTQICPRCNQAIFEDEWDEHMRIELLDPRWKQQKEAAEAKKKESNLLQEGTDVAKNLKDFSGYRSDIFGTEETEIGRKIGEEEEKRKRIEKEKVVWDGHTASINMATQRAAANVSIEEQIAAIHRSKGLTGDSKIGPKIPEQQGQAPAAPQGLAQPGYPGFPPASAPGAQPQTPGAPAFPGYVPSSTPFAHQLPGYIPQIPSSGQQPQTRQAAAPLNRPTQPTGVASAPPPPGALPQSLALGIVPPPGLTSQPPVPGKELGRLAEEELDGQMGKRQKLDSAPSGLVNEDDWMASREGSITLHIQCPTIPEKPEWNCNGQIIGIENLTLATLVSTVKERIAGRLNFPAGKQKLTLGNSGAVMKNQVSLESYNVKGGMTLGLHLKDRGKKQ